MEWNEIKIVFCVWSLCSTVAYNTLTPSLTKCDCGILFSLSILCHVCLKALKDTETPKQVLEEQITDLWSCSMPHFPCGNGEFYHLEAVQECWEQESINHKADAFIQGRSLDFYLWFLIVQNQVIFFKIQNLGMRHCEEWRNDQIIPACKAW